MGEPELVHLYDFEVCHAHTVCYRGVSKRGSIMSMTKELGGVCSMSTAFLIVLLHCLCS